MSGLRVAIVSSSVDIAGQGYRISQAFARHTDWDVRSMARERAFMAYGVDLPFRRSQLDELYQACDVFHARLNFGLYDQLAAKYGPKPVVLHCHGSVYRGDPNRYIREATERGATILCSTLDLYLLAPDISVWVPAPYDLDALGALV